MKILETIIATKHNEIQILKANGSVVLENSIYFKKETNSLKKIVKNNKQLHIIAEFKRQSPSKGIINGEANVQEVAKGYTQFGASAISILTDKLYFGGANIDVLQNVEATNTPILRKDFIIDEIQIIETKSIGADIVLLIAACLSPLQVKDLARFAKSLQLEVLLEIHNEAELQHINEYVDFVGVNNRNLKNFEVNLNHSIALCNQIPKQFIKVAESGIASANDVVLLSKEGFDAFLIGEMFMKNNEPGIALQQLISNVKLLQNAK